MATFVKLEDWKSGNYQRKACLPEVERRVIEMEIIEKLRATSKLPPGCFLVSAALRVEFFVQGSADEMRSAFDGWVRTYQWNMDVKHKDVVVEAQEMQRAVDIEGEEKLKEKE